MRQEWPGSIRFVEEHQYDTSVEKLQGCLSRDGLMGDVTVASPRGVRLRHMIASCMLQFCNRPSRNPLAPCLSPSTSFIWLAISMFQYYIVPL